MQRCPKWSIMIKCPLCPVPTINNWWKQIQNSKLLNKTIYQSKQSMIFFLSVTFGLVFSKCLLLMSFTIARSGNYLIWCLYLFVELWRNKKVTLQQISYSDETKSFHFQYISILVLILYMLKMWPLRKFQQWKPSDFLYCWSLWPSLHIRQDRGITATMNTKPQHPTLKNLQSRRRPLHHRRPPPPLKKWVLKSVKESHSKNSRLLH